MKTIAERFIDEITIVSGDVFKTVKVLNEIFGHDDWTVTTLRDDKGEVRRIEAVNVMEGGKALRVVEPHEACLCKKFLDTVGEGIFGMVERIPDGDWPKMLCHLESRGIATEHESDELFWADLSGIFGGCYGARKASAPAYPADGKGSLRQICLVTPDVEKTAEQLNEYLLTGPTEIGHGNSSTVTNAVNSDYPEGMPSFEFLAGMLFFGNMELEVVQPCHGPLAYFDYTSRRGQGFHHIKVEVPEGKWESTLDRYYGMGIREAMAGKIGTCGFSNLRAEDMLGFVYELSDGAPMLALPEGYDPYFYPRYSLLLHFYFLRSPDCYGSRGFELKNKQRLTPSDVKR